MSNTGSAGAWATNTASDAGGASERAEPADAFKKRGYRAGEPPTAESMNWLLSQIPVIYTSLVSAIAELPDDALFWLRDSDTDGVPGTEIDGASGTGTLFDVSGRHVVWATGTGATMVYATDLATSVATYTKTNSGNVSKVLCDGARVLLVYGQYVECFLIDGTQQWVYDHGATIWDAAWDGTYTYIVGNAGTGTHHARALHIAGVNAGTAVWSYDHGAALLSVATDGQRVFVAGQVSAHGSGATLRSLNAANGADAANEGGTSADTAELAWDRVTPVVGQRSMICNGRFFAFVTFGIGAVQNLEVCAPISGEVVFSAALVGSSAADNPLSIDGRLLFVQDNGDLFAYDLQTFARRWVWRGDPFSLAIGTGQIHSDGSVLWVSFSTTSANTLSRFRLGNTAPRLWRRTNPADRSLPLRLLALPQES